MVAKKLGSDDIVEFQAPSPGGSATFEETITPNGSGTSGHPITIRARPGDNITIDGGQVRGNTVYFYLQNYIIFDGLNFINATGVPVSGSVSINQSNNITVQNCTIHVPLVGDGIAARRGLVALNNCNSLQLLNNHIYIDDGSWGPGETDCIFLTGSNILVQGNYLSMHNAFTGSPSGHNDCGQTLNCQNLVINGNTFDRSVSAMPTQGQGIICEWYNISGNANPTNYGTARISNNIIFGHFGSYGVSCNSRNEPYTSDAIVSLTFENNTVDSYNDLTSLPAQFVHDTTGTWSGGTLALKNNIIIARRSVGIPCMISVQAPYTSSTFTCDYNHCYPAASSVANTQIASYNGVFYTWAQWQTAGFDAHGIGYESTGWVNPKFSDEANSDYSLQSQSPDVDAASNLSISFSGDRLGTPRPQGLGWDIGAYERIPLSPQTMAAPTFTTNPASQTVSTGSTVTLTASASGAPLPTYQWKLNGTNIPGAASSILILNNVSSTNSGYYTVVATNSLGSITSEEADLVINSSSSPSSSSTKPTISSQPVGQTVTSGINVTFTVAASGSPSPTYQWKFNSANISGATHASLTINSVTSANAGNYTVSVTNSAGSVTSQTAVLSVNSSSSSAGPTITNQPASQTVNSGSNVTFSVTASGSPTPTYQWRLNSVNINGATNASLILDSVTSANAGTYSAVVVNSAGSVISQGAILTVNTSSSNSSSSSTTPSISTQPASQTVNSGSNVTMKVVASGAPTPSYQWRLNSTNIVGATSSSLNLSSVTSLNAGTYSVVVSNTAGSVTSQGAVLVVNTSSSSSSSSGTPPTINTQPTSQTVALGGTATFSVVASGSPTLTYQWQLNGSNVWMGTSSTLNITEAVAASAGTYTVIVRNSAGSATSQGATLTVASNSLPKITTQPVSVTVNSGTKATFSVAATGVPTPTYQWRKNGINISSATSSSLTLNPALVANDGKYSVAVTNSSGSVISANATLVVTAPGAASLFVSPQGPTAPSTAVPSRLTNLSVRAFSAPGPQVLTAGFVVSGGSKSVLIRGIGPTLTDFGVTGVIADPQLSLFADGNLLQSDSGWGGSAALSNLFASLGAFALPPTSSDSAIFTTLASDSYTAEVASASGASGVALLEIYDADSQSAPSGEFVNLSVRSQVNSGDGVLIVGLVVTGNSPVRVLIRAIGPSLSQFGISNPLASPILSLYQGNALLQENSGWGGTDALSAAFSQVGAFPLTDPNSLDAAMIATLQPGVYSSVISGADNTTGIALAEIYVIH
jgi:hypothetical protein